MIEKYSIRTDLALEDKERFESDNVEVQGVSLSEDYDEEREIKVTTVKIETENGAKVMRKPVGTYITREAPNMAVPDEDYHREVSVKLSEYIEELNGLAHKAASTRLKTSASFLSYDDGINKVTDVIAWNQYFGWYGGSPSDMGKWLDANHKAHPEYKIAISEYGAGASIYHQQDSVKRGVASGWWHPENYQTYYHIGNWKALAERPFVWGSFIWNLFDFGAAHRVEGDRPGINDKGLVTFDRKVKKDAFYFYKANWNTEEPFVYITNRRHRDRSLAVTDIMIFSNQPEVELFVNGKSIGRQKPDEYATFEWKGVVLQDGENTIEARSTQKKNRVNDKVVWTVK